MILPRMEFEVWSEGYAATEECSKAVFHGMVYAESFRAACIEKFRYNNTFNSERLTLWGCKLFNNEADARKLFG